MEVIQKFSKRGIDKHILVFNYLLIKNELTTVMLLIQEQII